MTEPRFLQRLTPGWVLELFAAFNLGFLAVDVWLAHEINEFANPQEWAPVVFSALAPLVLLPGLSGKRYREPRGKVIGLAIGAASVVIGVAGLVFHLESAFFARQTLRHLVYSAPFVAPLSYVGIGLLIVLNRLERADRAAWGHWVVLLALAGFGGNFGLSLLDHAQNGFFRISEWIPVFAAAYAIGFLAPLVLGERRPGYVRVCWMVLVIQVLVGAAGSALHLLADLGSTQDSLKDRLVYGAPVFAPMLFADLALLAAIGIWQLSRTAISPAEGGVAQVAPAR